MNLRSSSRVLVGPEGGRVACITPDGEVGYDLPLSPGDYSGAYVFRLTGQCTGLEFSGDVSVVSPLPRYSVRKGPGHWDSAANPHFEVSDATRRANELERKMNRLDALARAAEKRFKMLDRATVAASAAADRQAAAEPVVEAESEAGAPVEGQS